MGQNDPKKGKVLGAKIAMFGECYIYCILVVVRDQELSNHVISHTPIAGNRYTNFVGGHIDLWQATCEAGEFFHVLAEQATHVQAKGVKFFLGLLLTGQGIELHNLANTQRN